jgi:catechol 2,3-dioxygenase-like lactoylglutathione lyase family enzyme
MDIKLVSSVIFVKDLEKSRRLFEETLEQKVLMDHGPNIGFEGGFALWQSDHAGQIVFGDVPGEEKSQVIPSGELYFETMQLDEAFTRIVEAGVEMIHPLRVQPWGQRVFRFYDFDRHIIELGEPMPAVIMRFRDQGQSLEEIAQKTFMPLDIIRQILG